MKQALESQGKKTTDTPVADVDVSKESEPEPAKKMTASRRVVKKKVTISADDNIIPDPDVALELGKSISLVEAKEEEASREVHATHARIVTESIPEPAKKKTGSRNTGSIVIQDTPSAPKSKPATSKLKLKGSKVESEYSKDDKGDDEEVDWIDSNEDEEKKDDTDDDKSIDLEMTNDEETDDEFIHGVEQVNDNEDEEMTNAEVKESGNDDEENTDAPNTNAGKTEEVKDDAMKVELPLRMLRSTHYWILRSNMKFHIPVPTVIDNYLGSNLGDALQRALQKHSEDLIQTQSVKPAPESSKIQTSTINLEQGSEKSASEILKIKREQAEKQKMPKYTIKSTDKAALKEYDQKSALYQTMHENKSFNRNPANHKLYHALMEALIEDENAMDMGVADTIKDHKRKHDDEDSPAGPNQGKKTKRRRTKELESSKKPSTTKETPKGKAPSKGSKTGKSASAKEPVEEPITEVAMDNAVNTTGKDVVRDDDQPLDTS
ncbi:hypothetical protein Tco_0190664 [Tanacetum coccineum]